MVALMPASNIDQALDMLIKVQIVLYQILLLESRDRIVFLVVHAVIILRAI